MICWHCKHGDKPIKLKRQYVHYVLHRIHVCYNKGIKPSAGDSHEPLRVRSSDRCLQPKTEEDRNAE